MTERFVLRDLPCSARVTLAAFLIAVALGYLCALVQLHVQHSRPGQLLPSREDVVRIYHGVGGPQKNTLQRLLEADESLPFGAMGTMAPAFTKRSGGWNDAIRQLTKERNTAPEVAEAELRKSRDGERHAMLAWLAAGSPRTAYDADSFPLPADLKNSPITAEFRDGDSIKIKTLITDRCVRCHAQDGEDDKAAKFPLDSYENLQLYLKPETAAGRMSLSKLAQSTHAHLLSFAVLFAFTGLLFALTEYPKPLRLILAPGVLVVQVVEIMFWWLARTEGPTGEMFAQLIPICGAAVGTGLVMQIGLILIHLFGWVGRVVLLVLLIVALFAANTLRINVVEPYLKARIEQVKN